MVDVSSAVQWWDEWQLRILVLGSLGMQWLLLLVALMRKYAIPWWFRTCIWLAYLGSDALAIYALATLFNRHVKAANGCDTVNGISGKGSILEVLWAPVLLIHLGGQEVITAYNIEDNELWPRHAVTLVSQVTVAVYAFYKSWPSSGDRRLLSAAILLFIIGVLSFSEKPWALKSATIDSMLDVSTSLRRIKREETSPSGVSSWLRFCFSEQGSREMIRNFFFKKELDARDPGVSERDKLHMILADMSLASADSELSSRGFRSILQQLDPTRGMGMGLAWVRQVFGLLYTRANVAHTPAYLAYHLLVAPSLHIAVITLLATSQKHGQNGTDLKVTYILLCFTAALDVVAVVVREVLHCLMVKADVPPLGHTVAQYNLIGSVLRRMRPMGWRPQWAEKICRVDRARSSMIIASFVIGNLLRDRTNVTGLDIASYRKFSESEGDNWALRPRLRDKCRGTEIEKSLQEPFDKSVLLWHIATDLCLRRTRPRRKEDHRCALLLWLWHIATDLCFRRRTRPADAQEKEEEDDETSYRQTCIEAISNYMAYLLNFRPNMLMTGSRQHLFTEASREVKSILKHSTQPSELDPKSLAEIISRAKPGTDYYLIPHACSLAENLLNLRARDGEYIMWEVMECVWEGMLCYSAGMCRGYLHAKALGEGGEFLSLIWFILSLKGVRILADKLQLPDKADGQEEPPTDRAPVDLRNIDDMV